MTIAIAITATVALLGIAVIFGADVVAAVVLRPTYAGVDDRTLVQAVGRGHHFGDRRLPVAGILGVVCTALTAALAFVAGLVLPGALASAALLLLLVWLLLFARISKPINARLAAAALADEVPADARALQQRWESIIDLRAVIQGAAVVLLALVLLLL
ncbi:DUF1772 domain-containing protein [Agromyces soli]|uniref:DUF1772 domain-containing protein n=1 Tax=Agromyces soli TaxID=659012 RepID=A0ABY4AXF0_9MICO|nr:DUF1772 domain-containing protein [Agromyces soli]UOE27865.1 DUF1772 domain-containing protein [Agromyces soli]